MGLTKIRLLGIHIIVLVGIIRFDSMNVENFSSHGIQDNINNPLLLNGMFHSTYSLCAIFSFIVCHQILTKTKIFSLQDQPSARL
jgi:hypothetical protein